jgi:hypothetical protein
MKLEQQLQRLAELGLPLNDGITVDDLLYSFSREEFEKIPFGLTLFLLGVEVEREHWDRRFCSRVWVLDTECITSTGSYVSIVRHLCELAGDAEYLTNVSDHVDIEGGTARLEYKIGDVERKWTVEVNDDWVDRMTLAYIIDDIERDGKRFYFKDNGQAMVLFFLDAAVAAELNRLSNGALSLMNPQ